jgi:hypothetical protein
MPGNHPKRPRAHIAAPASDIIAADEIAKTATTFRLIIIFVSRLLSSALSHLRCRRRPRWEGQRPIVGDSMNRAAL